MTQPIHCPCIYCEEDRERGRPLRLAKWRNTGKFWAPYGTNAGPVAGVERDRAHLFGPQHTAVLRNNHHFMIVKPRASSTRST